MAQGKSPATRATPGPPGRDISADDDLHNSPMGRRWALLVGVSNYRAASLNLRWARRDAEELARVLQEPPAGVFERDCIKPLYDEQATREAVSRELRYFLRKPNPEDLLLIYFACHGASDHEVNDEPYLLTHDTDPKDVPCTALPMRDLEFALSHYVRAKRVVVIVDACRAGGLAGRIGRRSTEAEMNHAVASYLKSAAKVKPGLSMLLATKTDKSAQEDEKWGGGHGVFTHYLLGGLRGEADGFGSKSKDGMVTVGELYRYVHAKVMHDTGGEQEPWMNPDASTDLPLAVTGGIQAMEHEKIGQAMYELGWLFEDGRRFSSAAAQFREAVRLRERAGAKRSGTLLALGLAEMAAGRAAEASGALEAALEGADEEVEAEARYHLGLALAHEGRGREARQALEGFARKYPANARAGWARGLSEELSIEPLGRKRALLIGVGKYPGIRMALAGVAGDLEAMRRLLEAVYGFDPGDIEILLDEAATREGILRAFDALNARAANEDLVFVYFTGHSDPRSRDQRGSTEEGDLFLFTYDYPRGGVGADELHEQMKALPCARKTLVTDAAGHDRMLMLAERQADYTLLMGQSPGEVGYEIEVDGRYGGAFTRALLRALGGGDLWLDVPQAIARVTARALSFSDFGKITPRFAGDASPIFSNRDCLLLSVCEVARHRRYETLRDDVLRAQYRWVSMFQDVPEELLRGFGQAFVEKRMLFEARDALEAACEREPVAGDTRLSLTIAQARAVRPDEACATLRCWGAGDEMRAARLAGTLSRLEGLAGGRKYALVVGIDRYTGRLEPPAGPIAPLAGASNDAAAMKRALVERCGFLEGDVVLLRDYNASREAILSGFRELLERAREAPALFFFAGYGSLGPNGEPTVVSSDGRRPGIFDIALDELAGKAGEGTNLLTIFDAGWTHCVLGGEAEAARGRTLASDQRCPPAMRDIVVRRSDSDVARLFPRVGYVSVYQGGVAYASMSGGLPIEGAADRHSTVHGLLTRALLEAIPSGRADVTCAAWVSNISQLLLRPYVAAPKGALDAPIFSNDRVCQDIADEVTRLRDEPLRGLLREALLPLQGLANERTDLAYEAYLHLGLIHAELGEHEQSVAALERALQGGREHPEVQRYLGRELQACGKFEASVSVLKEAARREPECAAGHYYLGRAIHALIEQENEVAATKAFQTYLERGAPLGREEEVEQLLARWRKPLMR
jgi:uncharacterized caspase-like protein